MPEVQTPEMWVVTSGEYSHYRVACICDSEERARRIAAMLGTSAVGWYDHVDVATIPYLDVDPEIVEEHRRRVTIDGNGAGTADHRVTKFWEFDGYRGPVPLLAWRWEGQPLDRDATTGELVWASTGHLTVWGSDAEAVARVFSDRCAEFIADPARRDQREAGGIVRP